MKQEDLSIPEGCSTCCNSCTDPQFPGTSLGSSRSLWWGGVYRSQADPSQPPPSPLSLSPDSPRSCTLTGEEGGWTQAPWCCTPTPHLHARPGSTWGGAGCGTHGCSFALGSSPGDCCQLRPMPPQRRDAHDGAGVCRAPESLRDAQSKGSRARRVLMVLQMLPKLVSSRRCSCRLGRPLLLALYSSRHSCKCVPPPCPPTWHR